MGRLAPPLPRRFKQSLAPRPRLACAGELLLHLAQGLLTALELGFGDRQIVGSLAPLTLGGGDGIEQAPAPLLDLCREVGKRGKVGTRFGLARAQDLDLLARLGDAILPKLPLSRDRLKPLLPQANLSFEAFQRRLCPRRLRTARSGLPLRGLECSFEGRERGKTKQGGLDPFALLAGFTQCSAGSCDRFGEGAELFAVGLGRALCGGDSVARAVKLAVRLLCPVAKCLGLLSGTLGFAGGLSEFSLSGTCLGVSLGSFIFERLEPAPLDEPCPGRARRTRPDAIAVPAPEIALPGDEPLPGGKFCLQIPPALRSDDADLGEAACQNLWRLDELAERCCALRDRGIA